MSRTFYAKGQTGQQLLLGAYSAMNRQIGKGKITPYNRHEMVDLVKIDGKARGIIARDLETGQLERHSAHAVVVASGGYGNVFFFFQLMLWDLMLQPPGKYIRRGLFCKSLLHTDSPYMYPKERRSSVQTYINVRIFKKRW